jgi:hypothetical protein
VIPIAERHVLTGGYASSSQIFPVAEGWLTQVQIRSSSAGMLRGQTFAILEVIRGREGAVQSLGTLLQGYVTTNWRLAWPGAALESSLSGRGKLRYIGGNNPAAGAEISESVPAGVRWLLKTFTFVLVASAAAANRSPILTIDDGATVIFETGSNVLQTASQTAKYRAGAGVPLALYDTRAYHSAAPAGSVARRRLAHSHGDGRTRRRRRLRGADLPG